jgi:hypothetical protein
MGKAILAIYFNSISTDRIKTTPYATEEQLLFEWDCQRTEQHNTAKIKAEPP